MTADVCARPLETTKSNICTYKLAPISHILKNINYLWDLRKKNNINCATLFACRMKNNKFQIFLSFNSVELIQSKLRQQYDEVQIFPFIECESEIPEGCESGRMKTAWMRKEMKNQSAEVFPLNVQSCIDWITIH